MRVRCPVMVGREVELARLLALVASAQRGAGGAAVVEGPAGIGKSRLVRQLTEAAPVPLIAVGRCVPNATLVPFRPLVEAVFDLGRQRPLPNPTQLGVFGLPLSLLVTEWAIGGPPKEASPLVLGEGLLRLLGMVAPEGSLLVLEDLHWADVESVAVIEYLCDHAADAPFAVVATIRSGHVSPAVATVRALVDRGAVEHHQLMALRPGEVEEMVRACGSDRSAQAAAAEGVPLLVEEILGAGGDGVAGVVPATIQASVDLQLVSLGRQVAEALLGGALLGRRFDWESVAAALGQDPAAVVGQADGRIQAMGTDARGRRRYPRCLDAAARCDAGKCEQMVEFAAALGPLRRIVTGHLAARSDLRPGSRTPGRSPAPASDYARCRSKTGICLAGTGYVRIRGQSSLTFSYTTSRSSPDSSRATAS
jgi:AAA ATPase domain